MGAALARRARKPCALGGGDRKSHSKACSAPLARLARKRAAVRLDDVPRDGQPEAGSLALGREKRVEYARPDLLRNSATPVVDVHDDAHPFGAHADVDGPPLRHGLTRVAQEVEQGLTQLRLVE